MKNHHRPQGLTNAQLAKAIAFCCFACAVLIAVWVEQC